MGDSLRRTGWVSHRSNHFRRYSGLVPAARARAVTVDHRDRGAVEVVHTWPIGVLKHHRSRSPGHEDLRARMSVPSSGAQTASAVIVLSLIHISEPTRRT